MTRPREIASEQQQPESSQIHDSLLQLPLTRRRFAKGALVTITANFLNLLRTPKPTSAQSADPETAEGVLQATSAPTTETPALNEVKPNFNKILLLPAVDSSAWPYGSGKPERVAFEKERDQVKGYVVRLFNRWYNSHPAINSAINSYVNYYDNPQLGPREKFYPGLYPSFSYNAPNEESGVTFPAFAYQPTKWSGDPNLMGHTFASHTSAIFLPDGTVRSYNDLNQIYPLLSFMQKIYTMDEVHKMVEGDPNFNREQVIAQYMEMGTSRLNIFARAYATLMPVYTELRGRLSSMGVQPSSFYDRLLNRWVQIQEAQTTEAEKNQGWLAAVNEISFSSKVQL